MTLSFDSKKSAKHQPLQGITRGAAVGDLTFPERAHNNWVVESGVRSPMGREIYSTQDVRPNGEKVYAWQGPRGKWEFSSELPNQKKSLAPSDRYQLSWTTADLKGKATKSPKEDSPKGKDYSDLPSDKKPNIPSDRYELRWTSPDSKGSASHIPREQSLKGQGYREQTKSSNGEDPTQALNKVYGRTEVHAYRNSAGVLSFSDRAPVKSETNTGISVAKLGGRNLLGRVSRMSLTCG